MLCSINLQDSSVHLMEVERKGAILITSSVFNQLYLKGN